MDSFSDERSQNTQNESDSADSPSSEEINRHPSGKLESSADDCVNEDIISGFSFGDEFGFIFDSFQTQQEQGIQKTSQTKPTSVNKGISSATHKTLTTGTLSAKQSWRTHWVDASIVQNENSITTVIKSRELQATEAVPDQLYSSIKYELVHHANYEALKFGSNPSLKDVKYLMSKIEVVDPKTLKEIRKCNNNCILDGNYQENMLPRNVGNGVIGEMNNETVFESVMKLQFNDVSYHHSKKKFAFMVSYFLGNLEGNPILQKVSSPFLVLARKPSEKSKEKRRYHKIPFINQISSTVDTKPMNISMNLYVQNNNKPMQLFDKKLNDLIEIIDQMNSTDKSNAIQTILSRMRTYTNG